MKRIVFFTIIALIILITLSKFLYKKKISSLPQECITMFDNWDTLLLKLETSAYIPKQVLDNHRLDRADKEPLFRRAANDEKLIKGCELRNNFLEYKLDKLKKVESLKKVAPDF